MRAHARLMVVNDGHEHHLVEVQHARDIDQRAADVTGVPMIARGNSPVSRIVTSAGSGPGDPDSASASSGVGIGPRIALARAANE